MTDFDKGPGDRSGGPPVFPGLPPIPPPGAPDGGFATPFTTAPPGTVAPRPARTGPDGDAGGDQGRVPGRTTIDDEVIEKIALLAALEVRGVAAVGVGTGPGGEPAAGTDRRPAVRVRLHDDRVSLDLALTVEYGSVIMAVAAEVRANVARVVGLMLDMRVDAVNLAVEDVQLPGRAGQAPGRA
ncbi:Asp23/Gls24 family envelope stress response protein [Actinomadura rayongensis]|uniref:Asp23/Gls24 family envelope stress response protein n=1 Tax=Actinomadura rayongensis TaxID=1429076 RepID=A0A6I4WLK8_9ACTN|nr:Asp23/Gls24 family envelope stress response protein [Actinomadura rayongensis]MXQ67512.1 Asp23/Gls24 family envelope stress response protein [Actinomadura rayongensis]